MTDNSKTESISSSMQFDNKQNKQKLIHFCYSEEMASNFQINYICIWTYKSKYIVFI